MDVPQTPKKKAYHKKYDYGSPEKYRLFLKKNFLTLEPTYYSVASCTEVDTVEGPMYAIHIVSGALENPELETIAEVWINDEFVYLWRDHCWGIAVNKDNHPIITSKKPQWSMTASVGKKTIINQRPQTCDKSILIHKIGHQAIE